jgi:hypothetical protein
MCLNFSDFGGLGKSQSLVKTLEMITRYAADVLYQLAVG